MLSSSRHSTLERTSETVNIDFSVFVNMKCTKEDIAECIVVLGINYVGSIRGPPPGP